MLSVLRAVGSADSEKRRLETGHVSVDEGQTKVEHLIAGSGPSLHETIGNALARLVEDETTESRSGRCDRDEGREEKSSEVECHLG